MAYSTRNETQYSPYDIVCIPTSFISLNNLRILLLVHVVWQKSGQLPPIHILYENERNEENLCVEYFSNVTEWISCGGQVFHNNDVKMGAMVSQITGLTIFYSTVLFMHRSKKTPKLRTNGQWREKWFHFDDVIMHEWYLVNSANSHVQNQSKNMAVQFQRVCVTSKANLRHSVVI